MQLVIQAYQITIFLLFYCLAAANINLFMNIYCPTWFWGVALPYCITLIEYYKYLALEFKSMLPYMDNDRRK